MPIEIDTLGLVSTKEPATYTPKFFHKEVLTGNGKGQGLLRQTVRPGRDINSVSAFTSPREAIAKKTKTSSASITTYTIPLAVLMEASLGLNIDKAQPMAVPHVDDRYEVTAGNTTLDFDVFVDLTPQGIIFYEDDAGTTKVKELNIQYRMEVFVLPKPVPGAVESTTVPLVSGPLRQNKTEFALVAWSYNPLDDIENLIREATRGRGVSGHSVPVDVTTLAEWMADYDVYKRICRLAEVWATDEIANELCAHIEAVFSNGIPDKHSLNQLAYQLAYLDSYNVSLDAYRQIHRTLTATCPPDIALKFSKRNLQLLMSHTLEHLNNLKPQLVVPPAMPAGVIPSVASHFSVQQTQAITTDEPLVLCQAGAGTGKSTVILGRIEHLTQCGVNPADITVLSFTNAAADNITAKNPNVGSMTIARMIHDIYSLNYPGHELSGIDTIINSLDIYYKQNDLAIAFRRRLLEVKKNAAGAFASMNTFIEANFDSIISILDKIRQTCLELEIIVCYERIDHMIEPPTAKSRYLIIDEVQDNSIFEFIYLLKYVAKHQENLFMVGDSSQTLFEFRSANPKALNALESSGVFTTYKLTTNYRSNQEILDFANVALADIEANQYAGIQLHANSLALPTAASFKEAVTLDYRAVPRLTAFTADMPGIIRVTVRDYIDKCLAKGEQVAFVAYSRKDVAAIKDVLTAMYPGEEIASLVSDRPFDTNVFSEYIKLHWNDICQIAPPNAAFMVIQEVLKKLDTLIRNAETAREPITRMCATWWATNADAINGWVALNLTGHLTTDQFFSNLMENLLDYEIKNNSIKKSVVNQKNKERKEKNLASKAKLVVSTIHGCKGLEFDNVVVIHKNDPTMGEEDKRMFYVAFTRAKKTEYILSYGTVKNARIESDYELLTKALEERDAQASLRLMGSVGGTVVVDEIVEDDDAVGAVVVNDVAVNNVVVEDHIIIDPVAVAPVTATSVAAPVALDSTSSDEDLSDKPLVGSIV